MDEQKYVHLADDALQRILQGFDAVDVDDAEAELAGDVLTITLASGKRIIVNTQKPARQIWLAGGASAWHFSYDEATGRWLDDKGRGDLYATVGQLTRELSGVVVEFGP